MAEPPDMDVLCSVDVANILKHKSLNMNRLKVSMKGTVTAVSQILGTKKDYYFLTEVDRCVYILIKDFKLEWHTILEPNRTYIFYRMMRTTIEKGTEIPLAVLMAWNDSSLIEINSDDSIPTSSLKRWLLDRGKEIIVTDPAEASHVCLDHNFVNYEGTVTSTQDAADGFFTLDNKIRFLCFSHLLPVNSEVAIWNGHFIKVGSCAYLVCCKRSLVRIKNGESFKSNHPDEKEASSLPQGKTRVWPIGIKSIFQKYDMTLTDILTLLHFRDFVKGLGGRSQATACRAAKKFVSEIIEWKVPLKSGKQIENFICHDDICLHTKTKANKCHIPKVISISDVKQEAQAPEGTGEADKKSKQQKGKTAISKHFSYAKDHMILVGTIQADFPEYPTFKDLTGCLPVLLLIGEPERTQSLPASVANAKSDSDLDSKTPSFKDSNMHVCYDKCMGINKLGKPLSCSFLDYSLLGKVICVKTFHVITEENFSSEEGNPQSELTYLAFSLQDCVLLDDDSSIRNNKISSPLESTSQSISINKLREPRSIFIIVENKLPLKSAVSRCEQLYEFEVIGSLLSPAQVRNIEKGGVKTRRMSQENLNNESQRKPNSLNASDDPVSLHFAGPAAKWFHFFNIGNVYQLTSQYDSLSPSYSNSYLQKSAKRCKIRQQIIIREDVKVQRIGTPYPVVAESLSQQMFTFTQDGGNFQSVMSVQGRIKECNFSESKFAKRLDCKTSSHFNMCLLIDVTDTDISHISVYMEAPGNIHSLGLVPGSVVHFSGLERKVSKAGNMYCRFTVASSLQVLNICPVEHPFQPVNHNQNQQPMDLSGLPHTNLADLWNLQSDEAATSSQSHKTESFWALECFICSIFKLSIKTVCSVCKGSYAEGYCRKRQGCGSASFPELITKATLLIDDGSGQALVNVKESNIVAKLFTFNKRQWKDVIDGLSDCGELLLTKDNQAPPIPTAQLLSVMCSSPSVLRLCRMAVCRGWNSACQQSVDAMTLDEFQLKDVRVAKTSVQTWTSPLLTLDCAAIEEFG